MALFSGGLDSQLAICLMRAQGIDVCGLVFRSIFFEARMAEQAAARLGVALIVEDFTTTMLGLIEHPRHGFGAGLNPCIDCHIAMVRRAGELMRANGFGLVCTGEVLNQRPMSQHRKALLQVAEESGVGDYLLRPLSARLLPETVPEKTGLVNRAKLLALEGRNRKPQMELARAFGITTYPQPAGGCILTDPLYGKRLRDLRNHEGLNNMANIRRLRMGRHFRLGACRLIVGRNQAENAALAAQVRSGEWQITARDLKGPLALLYATASEENLLAAASICAFYAKAVPSALTAVLACRDGCERILNVRPVSADDLEHLRL